MTAMQWTQVPDTIGIAFDYVQGINELRTQDIALDGSEKLAFTVANNVLRSYFAEILRSVESGELSPSEIKQMEFGSFSESYLSDGVKGSKGRIREGD